MDLRGQDPGACQLQYVPGRSRTERTCRGYFSGTGNRQFRIHERPFPPKMQIVVDLWANMEHAARKLGGALPNQLHPGDGPPCVIKRVVPVCITQLGSLPCSGMSSGGTNVGAYAIPWNQAPLPPLNSTERELQGMYVLQTLRGGTQATIEGTRPPGVDLSRDLAPC